MRFKDEGDAALYEVDKKEFGQLRKLPSDVAIQSGDMVVVFVDRAEEKGLVGGVLEDALTRNDEYDMVLFACPSARSGEPNLDRA